MGLGRNKQSRERAAYLAHMYTSCCKPMPCAPEMLRPGQKRYDLLTEKLPEHNGASQLHAVIWHAGQFKGFFDADEAKARQRFEELKGGPFAAALVDPNCHYTTWSNCCFFLNQVVGAKLLKFHVA